jgi:hypothetical protein
VSVHNFGFASYRGWHVARTDIAEGVS